MVLVESHFDQVCTPTMQVGFNAFPTALTPTQPGTTTLCHLCTQLVMLGMAYANDESTRELWGNALLSRGCNFLRAEQEAQCSVFAALIVDTQGNYFRNSNVTLSTESSDDLMESFQSFSYTHCAKLGCCLGVIFSEPESQSAKSNDTFYRGVPMVTFPAEYLSWLRPPEMEWRPQPQSKPVDVPKAPVPSTMPTRALLAPPNISLRVIAAQTNPSTRAQSYPNNDDVDDDDDEG